eukprot:1175891-Prorocentrum_minimum.AAC.1
MLRVDAPRPARNHRRRRRRHRPRRVRGHGPAHQPVGGVGAGAAQVQVRRGLVPHQGGGGHADRAGRMPGDLPPPDLLRNRGTDSSAVIEGTRGDALTFNTPEGRNRRPNVLVRFVRKRRRSTTFNSNASFTSLPSLTSFFTARVLRGSSEGPKRVLRGGAGGAPRAAARARRRRGAWRCSGPSCRGPPG